MEWEDIGMAGSSKTVRLNLTPDEWRALRVGAAEEGVSVAAYATTLIRAQLGPTPKRGAAKKAGRSES